MLRHKHIDRICCAVLALTLLLAALFTGAAATGRIAENTAIGYEARLFDTARVHTIDIVMDDWDAFLASCTGETYASCHLVIDGESYKNVAIRGKGNTSLTNVAEYGNGRYSFKVEFDHYQSGATYHGLDKLSLNNLIQDNTYMKDYFAYTLMRRAGVAAPLCSFVQINVNGEPWGLYLAVEGVEDAFLQRNYGKAYGELYKPDSLSFGGGRGNGGGFDMNDFMENFDFTAMPDKGGFTRGGGMGGGRGFGGNGSDDVKLQYIDDDPASYANIFNNAKTDVTAADQTRLITSLKALSAGDVSVVDTDAVIRYMAVHNFLCNDDSYTGMMVHNYYLYEEDGVLSMIPWDYNLAFGGFGGGSAANTVNTDIGTLVSGGSSGDRPMADWITASETYTAQYLAAYAAFIADSFDSGWFAQEIDRVTAMIGPFVQSDPTAFCTYEEFQKAAETLRAFCIKRAESASRQLAGDDTPVDASGLTLSDMGSMGNKGGGFGGGRGGNGGFSRSRGNRSDDQQDSAAFTPPAGMEFPANGTAPQDSGDSAGFTPPAGMEFPANGAPPQDSSDSAGFTPPAGMEFPANGTFPQDTGDSAGFTPPAGMEFPANGTFSQGASSTDGWIWVGICAALLCAAVILLRRYPLRN